MNRFYILIALLFTGFGLSAQQEAVSGCNDPNGGIQIRFNAADNCSALADLTEFTALGFHSGANGWMNVVEWSAGATAENQGEGLFVVYIADPEAYYGLDNVTRFDFVFNQGATAPADPWSAEGKGEDADGNCVDFFVERADITETCDFTVSTIELAEELNFRVSPNPFGELALVEFANPQNDAFQVVLNSIDGQELRRWNNVRGEQLRIEKGNLTPGYYSLRFISADGRVGATKLIVK